MDSRIKDDRKDPGAVKEGRKKGKRARKERERSALEAKRGAVINRKALRHLASK